MSEKVGTAERKIENKNETYQLSQLRVISCLTTTDHDGTSGVSSTTLYYGHSSNYLWIFSDGVRGTVVSSSGNADSDVA